MKKLLALVLLASCAPPERALTLAATFNVRTDRWDADPEGWGTWDERREAALETVLAIGADLWAFQEVGDRQEADLRAALEPTHDVWSFPDGGAGSQLLAYRRDAFEVVSRHSAIAAEEPELRFVGGVALEERESGRRLFVVGTHLSGTEPELELVRRFALRFPLPAILMGDFNSLSGPNPWVEPGLPVVAKGGYLRDLFQEAPHDVRNSSCWPAREEDLETCSPLGLDARIDWVLGTREFRGAWAETVHAFVEGSGLPVSDHFPQVVGIEWGR